MAKDEDNIFSAIGFYNGHSCKNNYDVELRLRFTEIHLDEALQFVAGIGARLKLIANTGREKLKLGIWSVYRLSVDKNAQTTVVLKTMLDQAFVGNIPKLMEENEENEIELKAQIINE